VSDEPLLRPATPDDAGVLSRLNVAAWRWAYRDLVDADYLASLDPGTRTPMWSERLASTLARTVVAERDGRVLGYVTYGPAQDADATSAVGHVFAIYVAEHAQGTGVGKVLMVHALHELAADGRTEATLWVLDTNALARRFYERGGWRPDGTTQDEQLGGASLHEVRYRRPLP